ncbi:hypothetical protein QR680_003561 [Steinernema hermaphroditum]|uniref:Uncharacterized protein n=1 Tax=Steinernema hermaphroditum TaxID=289476 RepID=A0AA39HKT6_9BILA|nr:hypothetical protein QR680_003561 [Steinernema hermaphroditum]
MLPVHSINLHELPKLVLQRPKTYIMTTQSKKSPHHVENNEWRWRVCRYSHLFDLIDIGSIYEQPQYLLLSCISLLSRFMRGAQQEKQIQSGMWRRGF